MRMYPALFFRLIFLFVLYLSFQSSVFSKEGDPIPFKLKQQNEENISTKELVSQTESLLFEKTNKIHEEKKINILNTHALLYKAALLHSKDMFQNHYFSHFSPDGKGLLERVRKLKPDYDDSCGENLHQIYSPKGLSDPQAIADQMMKDWLGSIDHRKNIYSKEYTLMAVACVSDGNRIICTQDFSGPNL